MNWDKLAEIGPPEKWLEIYKDYLELLLQEDVRGFWQEQFNITNKERNQLKSTLHNMTSVLEVQQELISELREILELNPGDSIKEAVIKLKAQRDEYHDRTTDVIGENYILQARVNELEKLIK